MKQTSIIIAAAILAVGMALMGLFVKLGMDNRTYNGRTISVRGVATKRVTANYATGYLYFSAAGETPQDAKQTAKEWTSQIIEVAKQFNLPDEAISTDPISVDLRSIYNDGRVVGTRYYASCRIRFYIDSTGIMDLYNFDLGKDCLIDKGVLIEYSDIQFKFSDDALTNIKPEMLTTATENARLAASQLAENNNSSVGRIVSATQGYFEVNEIDGKPAYEKEVRVVNYAEFYLK